MAEEADIPAILRRPASPGTAASRVAGLLGGSETAAYTGMTLGEVVYDRVSIDPQALEAFEFAHKPALGDIHGLATWANDTLAGPGHTVEGRISRLQGYVFERVAAMELRQGGAVVTLPSSPTNPGWDLLVNGDKVQAKCGSSAGLVHEHFQRYPDIRRVVVNEELAAHFRGDDRVIAVGITRDLIRDHTERSLHAASDMLDLSMVRFAPALSVVRNGWAMWKQNTDLAAAAGNVVVDGTTRLLGAMAGKAVGIAAVSVLAGGWPAILAPVVASAAGYRGGRAVADLFKRHVLLRTESVGLSGAVVAWCAGCARVLDAMVNQAAAASERFRAARERAGRAWTPLMDDWLERLNAEQAYRRLHMARFTRASADPGALGGEPGALGAAGAAMLAASRAGLLPSDLPAERKALLAAAETYSGGLRRRLLS